MQCKRGESMVCTRGSIDGLDSQCTITTTVVTKLSGNKVTNLHSRQLKIVGTSGHNSMGKRDN